MLNEKQIVEKLYKKYKRPVSAREVQEITKKTRGNTLQQLKSFSKVGLIRCLGQRKRNQYFFKPLN